MDEWAVASGEVMQGAMHRGFKEVEMADNRDSRGARWEAMVF